MAKKQHALLTAVGLGLALVIGILVVIHSLEPDPNAIKADLEKKLAELEAIPPEQAVLKDARAEALLAVEEYSIHAKALRLKLERLHNGLHEAAIRDRAAEKEVPPFLARCKDLSKLSLEELGLRASEGRSLKASHGGTRFGPPLQVALEAIARRVEELKRNLQEDLKRILKREDVNPVAALVELQRQVQALVKKDQYAEASRLVDQFDALKVDAELKAKNQELRDIVKRKRQTAAARLLSQSKELEGESKGAEAVRLLETALPHYTGSPEAGEIEAALRRLKPR